MTTTTVQGTEVLIEGQGIETIVCIHGWPDTHRVWDRTLKYYESMRVVYEIQSRLKDLSDQDASDKSEQKKPEGSVK